MALHPSLASGRIWSGVRRCLPEKWRFAAPDMPGHGLAPAPDPGTDFCDLYTQQVTRLLQPGTDLVGHSFSAVIALRVALENPGLIRSLTLIEPVFFAAARGVEDAILEDTLARLAPYREALAAGNPMLAAERFTDVWGTGLPWDTLPRSTRAELAARIHLIPLGDSALIDDAPGLLAPGRLEGLDLPVLFLRGALSPPVVGVIHRALRARLMTSREVVVEGAGHMLTASHPEVVARTLAAFITRPDGPVGL